MEKPNLYIILLKFSDNKTSAGSFMESHKTWISEGLKDGVFLMVGSLQPNAGGVVLAHNVTQNEIETRVALDPFVIENVVTAEILEVTPAKASQHMQFLLGQDAYSRQM